jgi:predicted amidohydrolase
LSGDRILVAGFAERGVEGRTYNSAAVVAAGGILAVYRKAHLWDREKLYFEPGSQRPPVLDTAHGRIAVMICFDMEFPEWTRAAALAGADLLAVPTNWPLGSRPPGERPAEVLIGQAAARVNRMFIACCDRAGPERGQEWTQGTAIIDEHGWIAAGIGTEIVQADLDLSRAREKNLTDRVHLFDDRREDLY